MHTNTNRRQLHEKLTTNLVEIGLRADEADRIVDIVIDASENAFLSACITLEIALGSITGRNAEPSMHLALQVLVARIDGFVADLQDKLVAEGAETTVVDFGVRTDG